MSLIHFSVNGAAAQFSHVNDRSQSQCIFSQSCLSCQYSSYLCTRDNWITPHLNTIISTQSCYPYSTKNQATQVSQYQTSLCSCVSTKTVVCDCMTTANFRRRVSYTMQYKRTSPLRVRGDKYSLTSHTENTHLCIRLWLLLALSKGGVMWWICMSSQVCKLECYRYAFTMDEHCDHQWFPQWM